MVQFDIALKRLAEPVQPGIVGPPLLVGERIDDPLVARDPDQAGQRPGDFVGQDLPGLKALEPRGEAFRAVVVDRPGQQFAIHRNRNRAEPEIVVPFGQGHLVQDQLVRSACHRPAPPLLVFRAFLELDPVKMIAVLLRNRLVGLLDPRPHLLEQAVDPALLAGHAGFEPGVLRLKVGQNLIVLHLGIARIAQPGVIVGHGDAVVGFDVGLFWSDRGSGKCHDAALWWGQKDCKTC